MIDREFFKFKINATNKFGFQALAEIVTCLNYKKGTKWGDRRGSNPRHLDPQSNALTN